MKRHKLTKPRLVLGLIAVVYLAIFLWMGNYGAFWSEDAGVKYLQALNLSRSHWTDASLEYPGEKIDPRMDFNPLAGAHTYTRNGKIYSTYPLPFSFVSSLALQRFGFPGLYLIPFLSTLILLAVTYRLGRLFFTIEHALLMTAVTAFATPIFFYAFTFWEINIAASLLMIGLYLSLKSGTEATLWRMVTAGAIMGSAVFFRAELILFAVSYIIARVISRKDRRHSSLIGAGAGISVFGFLMLQLATEGSIMVHLFHNISVRPQEFSTIGSFLHYKWGLIYQLLFSGHPETRMNALLLAPVVALSLWLAIRGRKDSRSAYSAALLQAESATPDKRREYACALLFSAVLLSYLCYVVLSLFGRFPIRFTPFTSGLLLFSPWIAIGFYRPRGRGGIPVELFGTTVLFIVLMALVVPTSGGLQWGPRYLTAAYPLLVMIAWDSFILLRKTVKFRRRLTAVFLLLITVSLVHEGYGIYLLKRKKEFNRAVMSNLSSSPIETVVALPWWIPLSLAPIFPEKEFFAAREPGQLDRLIELLKKNRREDFILVAENNPRIMLTMAERYGIEPARIEQVRSGVDDYFTVLMILYRLPSQSG